MASPEDNRYAKSHEYVHVEGNIGTIGITEYAQKELGDVVFVELPQVGSELEAGDELGSIDDAVRTAGKLAGIKGEPDRLWPKRREAGLFDLLGSGDAETLLERVVSRRIPQFLYRW